MALMIAGSHLPKKEKNFAPLAQLTFILPDTKETVIVNAGTLYEAAEWNDLGDDCLINGFSITEDAETFEIKLENGKVVHSKSSSYQPLLFPGKMLAMDEVVLAVWLEKEIRESSRRYFTETLKEFVHKNIQALMETKITLAQLVRAKYVFGCRHEAMAGPARRAGDGKNQAANVI